MPQPAQHQDPPGLMADMRPTPDHGEESYVGSGRLANKKAVITGADSGIGKAVAIAYAREGADVLISYLDEDEDARDTARWVEDAGRRAVLLAGDLSDPAHCREVIATAVDQLGGRTGGRGPDAVIDAVGMEASGGHAAAARDRPCQAGESHRKRPPARAA